MSQPTVQDLKYRLDPPAKFALGKVTPQLAWEQVQALVAQCLEEYYQAAEELRQRMGLAVDLRNLQEVLGITNPVRGINNLHYSNPDLNLKALPEQPPLEVLQAVLKMLLNSDRWNSLKP